MKNPPIDGYRELPRLRLQLKEAQQETVRVWIFALVGWLVAVVEAFLWPN